MGTIRLLLALSVVAAHTGPLFGSTLVGGRTAVETFFMISGFYMALVINEKYFVPGQALKRAYKVFIEARIFRLYPLYLLLLMLTIAVQAILLHASRGTTFLPPALFYWRHSGAPLQTTSLLALAAANLLLVGQDWVMFSEISAHGRLSFTPNFWSAALPSWHFLFLPQAWTLGLELAFYLLAPLLVRRKLPVLLAVALGSYGLKRLLGHYGLNGDPWSYRFFPSELQYFVLGAISYKGYRWLLNRKLFQPWWSWLGLTCTISSILLFSHLHRPWEIDAYYLLMTVCIPLVFLGTKRAKMDRMIGELSYPVYMCHVLALQVLSFYGHASSLGVALATLLFASALLLGFDQPLERWRQRWIERQERRSIHETASPVSLSAAP